MKEVIVCKLFNFSGSNTHLKCLIKYLGNNNVILLFEEKSQLSLLDKVADPATIRTKVMSGLHPYAHLARSSKLSNLKETLIIAGSIIRLLFFCLRNNVRGITINVVEPEKYLYYFWMPFIRIRYIVHSTPEPKFTWFTSFTCNRRLGRRNRIITVSNANRAALCSAWQIKSKKEPFVTVVYNCVMQNHYSTKMNLKASERVKNIVTMGHIVAYKNPFLWVDVAKAITKRFNDVHFIWLGDGPLFDLVKTEIQNIERISFAGFIKDPNLYLENAAIYYQPSVQETQGIAVLEAMSHGLPCVVSDIGGLPESVENRFNGILVPSSDVDMHVAALEKLITDPELCHKYGSNSYKKCQELFNFEQFKTAMDKIYLNRIISTGI